ncbi:hypothetical protein ACFYVL_26440 [Streptomyces sp. NPDC004111]|uniref:hypothetical protein n=1 Tax=Streptomyces sp. NPDC004111 TaxID=3364690 RepID=UPI0036ABE562
MGRGAVEGQGAVKGRGMARGRGAVRADLARHGGPRTRAAGVVALVVLLSWAVVGCGRAGELKSAGAAPTAAGPVRLWPTLPPAKTPGEDLGVAETETAKGIKLPDGDVRKVDPVAVMKAEVAAHPDTYSGPSGLYAQTVARLGACARKPAQCPVLPPYYRDLTGDGRDELIIGVTMPEGQLAIRAYLAEKGGLTRIMGTSDAVISVAFAGKDLVLTVPSGISDYEYRTAWTWDARQHAMLATQDQIVHTGKGPGAPRPGVGPGPWPDHEGGTGPGTGTGTGPGTGAGTGPNDSPRTGPGHGSGQGRGSARRTGPDTGPQSERRKGDRPGTGRTKEPRSGAGRNHESGSGRGRGSTADPKGGEPERPRGAGRGEGSGRGDGAGQGRRHGLGRGLGSGTEPDAGQRPGPGKRHRHGSGRGLGAGEGLGNGRDRESRGHPRGDRTRSDHPRDSRPRGDRTRDDHPRDSRPHDGRPRDAGAFGAPSPASHFRNSRIRDHRTPETGVPEATNPAGAAPDATAPERTFPESQGPSGTPPSPGPAHVPGGPAGAVSTRAEGRWRA